LNAPFDNEKYERLSKGLEINEVMLSYCKNFIDFRIDSNTYKKEYIELEEKMFLLGAVKLGKYVKSVKNFGAYSLTSQIVFTEEGLPFLRAQNVKENFIDWENLVHIDENSHDLLDKSWISKGQVLMTMAGEYLGKAAVYEYDKIISSNQAIAKITLKDNAINPYYLATFINSTYGQSEVNQLKTITGQPNINMMQIQQIVIPIATSVFQSKIEELVRKAQVLRDESKDIVNKATTIIMDAVGIDGKSRVYNKVTSINVKSFREALLKNSRLDAEFFQPKYDDLMNALCDHKHMKLSEIVEVKKSIEPGSDEYQSEGIPFIRVSNLEKYEISPTDVFLDKTKFGEEDLFPKKDEILFSKDGTVGIAHHLIDDGDFIPSSAILRLRIFEEIDLSPEYLTAVLNSDVVQLQAVRDAGGSIIKHWRVPQVEGVIIPILTSKKREEIKELVLLSLAKLEEAQQLNKLAKQSVKMLIDENEENALKYLKQKVSEA